jgi:hypothetical protein
LGAEPPEFMGISPAFGHCFSAHFHQQSDGSGHSCIDNSGDSEHGCSSDSDGVDFSGNFRQSQQLHERFPLRRDADEDQFEGRGKTVQKALFRLPLHHWDFDDVFK